jgi:putative ABC transport system ATP-binding protein
MPDATASPAAVALPAVPGASSPPIDRTRGAPVFVARGLEKTYGSGATAVQALRGIDLEIHAGEFIVMLGASGSGKSTLLNILGGLDRASGGSARWRDHDLCAADDDELTLYRRDHVGFVFQFYNLIATLTARENVELVCDIARDPMDAAQALALVGLGERLDHFVAELSGGEQQRVAIARAIAKRPDVLLCDEPTGALDCATGVLVLQALEKVNRELGTTTMIITHNLVIAAMADRVLRLADGRIATETRNPSRQSAAGLHW